MIFTVAKIFRVLFKSFIIQMLQTKRQEKEYLEILNNVSSGIIVLKQDTLEV
jgi:nitrogen-specific signal transduction histidine kinase